MHKIYKSINKKTTSRTLEGLALMKDAVRSGVTFDRAIYEKLDLVVKNSKRYKIDKSEVINALVSTSALSLKDIQKLVMDYREKNDK